MQAMESGNLPDRLAATGRWTVLVILSLVFAASNNFDSISAIVFVVVLVWAIALTVLNILSQRLPGHPWSVIVGDGLAALILFFLAGSNTLGWAALLPALSGGIYFGLLGGLAGAAIPLILMAVGLASLTSSAVAFSALTLPAVFVLLAGAGAGYGARQLPRAGRGQPNGRRAPQPERRSRPTTSAANSPRTLYSVLASMNSTLNYERVLDLALDVSITALNDTEQTAGFMVSAFYLLDEDDVLKVGTARRYTPGDLKNALPGLEGMVARAIKTNAPTLIQKPVEDPELRRLVAMHNCAAAYCYPLRTGQQLHGVLLYGHPTPGFFNDNRREVLEMVGRQALVALQNAALYRELQQDRKRMAEISEEANKKLARDLHDGPTQSVAAIAMRVNFARRMIDRDIKAAADELYKIEDLARRTTKEIRHMLFTLRPLVLESSGLVAALESMAEKMKETYSQNVLIEADQRVVEELEMGKQGVIFYIAEEAVNNARKHAEAEHIWVRLKPVEGNIALLEVQDDGVGFNVGAVDTNYEKRGSLGMVNLRERTEMLNGRLKLESKEGAGTRMRVWVPLNEDAAVKLRHGG